MGCYTILLGKKMEATDLIPREHFNKWYELFKQSDGRFLCNPIDGEKVYVRYTFDDMQSYNNMCEAFTRLTTNIKETKRGFWKLLMAKIGV